jgi:hypothetical protein
MRNSTRGLSAYHDIEPAQCQAGLSILQRKAPKPVREIVRRDRGDAEFRASALVFGRRQLPVSDEEPTGRDRAIHSVANPNRPPPEGGLARLLLICSAA